MGVCDNLTAGGIYGRLDGLMVFVLFIIAVVISFGVMAMPKGRAQS